MKRLGVDGQLMGFTSLWRKARQGAKDPLDQVLQSSLTFNDKGWCENQESQFCTRGCTSLTSEMRYIYIYIYNIKAY